VFKIHVEFWETINTLLPTDWIDNCWEEIKPYHSFSSLVFILNFKMRKLKLVFEDQIVKGVVSVLFVTGLKHLFASYSKLNDVWPVALLPVLTFG
jgi:hypothetical protein